MAGLQSSNPLSIFLKFHIWRLNVSSRCSLSPINNISSPFQLTLQSKYLRFSQFSLLSSQLSHLSLLSSQISFLNFPGKCWKWGHWGFSLSQLSVWFCWSSLISDELTTFLLLLHLLLPAMVITPKHCPFIFTFSFSVTQLPLFSIVKVLNLCFFFIWNAGTAVDQGIAYILMLVALAITYMLHWFVFCFSHYYFENIFSEYSGFFFWFFSVIIDYWWN